MVAQNNMSKQTREMEQAMERLSSGLRLTADDELEFLFLKE